MKKFLKSLSVFKVITIMMIVIAVCVVIMCPFHVLFAAAGMHAMLWLSPIDSERTKSLGGLTYTKNRYGNVGRARKKPINRKTIAQVSWRALFTIVIRAYKILSRANQDAWSALAMQIPRRSRLGSNTVFLSGQALFNSLNLYLSACGQPLIAAAPDVALNVVQPNAPFSVAVNLTPGTEDFTLTLSYRLPIDSMLLVWSTGVVSPAKQFVRNYKLIGVLDSTFATPGSIMSLYLAKFGVMPLVGDSVWFQIQMVDSTTGFHATKQITSTIAAL